MRCSETPHRNELAGLAIAAVYESGFRDEYDDAWLHARSHTPKEDGDGGAQSQMGNRATRRHRSKGFGGALQSADFPRVDL